MIANGSRHLVLASAAALAIICCSFTPTTNVAMAQVVPTPVQDMAWVRSGPDLIILGGYATLNGQQQYVSSQFLALDISTSWPATSAPWRALANGTASRSFYATSSPSNQTILTFKYMDPSSYTITAYDAGKNTWSPSQAVTTVPDILTYGLKPVTDPTTGKVYIAGIAGMNVYDPTSQTWTAPGPITGGLLTAKYFGSAVYNTARKTIMYVGGYNYGVNPTHFNPQVVVTEYSPSLGQWSVRATTGTLPSPVADHCSAVSDDGKTLIVFGGRTSILTPNTFTGALYILDIDTGVWTAGPSQTPRIYAACVLVGDQFVVWGGSANANDTLSSVLPIIFDVTLKKWVDNYKAPAYYLNNPRPKPTSGSGNGGGSGSGGTGNNNGGAAGSSDSGGSSSPSSSSGLGPIIGGVVGGLAVIGAIIGFLVYQRRQNKKLEQIKDQVSQQRMYIEEVERPTNAGVHISSRYRKNSGGGYTSSLDESSSTPPSYPMPPPSSLNDNTTTYNQYNKMSLPPQLQDRKKATDVASSPMSPLLAGTALTSNNYNSPQGPQSLKQPSPHAMQIYQNGSGGAVNGPQEYYSPSRRAPQALHNEYGITGNYHEQDSSRQRPNHPQEGAPHSRYE